MTTRKTPPDFSSGAGMWVNDEFFPPEVVAKLRKAIPRNAMTEEQASRFLLACAEWSHICDEEGMPHAMGKMRSELATVESEARRLLAALRSMHTDTISAFNAHFDYLAFGTTPPVALTDRSKALARGRLDARFLRTVWDLVEDLLLSAEYSASKIKPDRNIKPGQQAAKRLVFFVANSVVAITEHRPPFSKETWFPKFMEILGDQLGLPCGRALVESVVREGFPSPN